MKTAASEIPSELIPSIGTGCASVNVAASSSARTPPSTAQRGVDDANQNVATARAAKPESATGTRIGSNRAVSQETTPSCCTSPDALSEERTGRSFTCCATSSPYYQAHP